MENEKDQPSWNNKFPSEMSFDEKIDWFEKMARWTVSAFKCATLGHQDHIAKNIKNLLTVIIFMAFDKPALVKKEVVPSKLIKSTLQKLAMDDISELIAEGHDVTDLLDKLFEGGDFSA